MEQWVLRPGRNGKVRQIARAILFSKSSACLCLRIMPVLAAATAGGTLCGTFSGRIWLCPGLACLLVWLCRWRLDFKPDWLRIAVPALFLLSAIRIIWQILPAEQQADRLSGQDFFLQGTICSVQTGREATRQITIRQSSGITLLLQGVDEFLPCGTAIALSVHGFRPDGQRNPGGFNEKDWLASQGIYLITRPIADERPVVIKPAPVINLPEWGALIRTRFSDFASRHFGQNEAALLTGLLLGDTSGITADRLSDYRRAGLSHLTSVSGANVSLVLLPVILLVRRGRLNRKIRLWLLLGALVGFGFLTGWQISVSRAILMTGFVLAGQLIYRRADALNSLAAAAWLLILIRPLTVLSTGFWLSLIATAGILLLAVPLTEQLKERLPMIPGFLLTGPIASLCVQLALLPIICQISQEISFWGLLANLPAGPVASWISLISILYLPFGVIGSLLPGTASAWLLSFLGRPITIGLQLLDQLASLFAHQQSGRLASRLLNPAFWLAWMMIMLLLVRHLPGFFNWPTWVFQIARRICLPAAIAWMLAGSVAWLNQPAMIVWFLDVGQGDAILIQSGRNETILIDGGETGCGYRVLMPALDALGIRQIDLVIATHGHSDHIGGLTELVQAGRVGRFMMPAGLLAECAAAEESASAGQLVRSLKISGIGVSELAEDDTIVLGSQIRLDVIYTGPDASAGIPSDGNDRSLILLATLAGQRVLLTADCTRDTEQRLMIEGAWPHAEILKVAHHGSRLATGTAFLQNVQPETAIISVGPNVFGHPSADVLARLKVNDCQMLRTDHAGAVQLLIDQKHWQLHTMLSE